jgi:hypothetical protein
MLAAGCSTSFKLSTQAAGGYEREGGVTLCLVFFFVSSSSSSVAWVSRIADQRIRLRPQWEPLLLCQQSGWLTEGGKEACPLVNNNSNKGCCNNRLFLLLCVDSKNEFQGAWKKKRPPFRGVSSSGHFVTKLDNAVSIIANEHTKISKGMF